MQLYAFDSEGEIVAIWNARKQKNYFCMECKKTLRLRAGIHRKSHFFHLEPTPFCRQHQKGAIHLQLQFFFLKQLPDGDCRIEQRFKEINRIADVVWLSEKIVFEIQYSSISSNEVLQRNRDYGQLGWRVVWILHDHRFNKESLSAAEIALKNAPHYFTNMDAEGLGFIYDQFEICDEERRLKKLAPLSIDVAHVKRSQKNLYQGSSFFLRKRCLERPLHFQGDLLDLALKDPSHCYLVEALNLEKRRGKRDGLRKRIQSLLNRYRLFWQAFLEVVCSK